MALIKDKMIQSVSADKIIETEERSFLTKEEKDNLKSVKPVTLSSAVDSESEEVAATSLAVKLAYEKAEQAFQSASNGKVLIAEAIIGKGGSAETTDTFESMANAITHIPTGNTDINGTTGVKGVYMEEVKRGDTVKSRLVQEGLNEVLKHDLYTGTINHYNSTHQRGMVIEFSKDGKYLYLACSSVSKLYKIIGDEFVEVPLTYQHNFVYVARFSDDSRYLYLGSALAEKNGTVCVYALRETAEYVTGANTSGGVFELAISKQYICAVSSKNTHMFTFKDGILKEFDVPATFDTTQDSVEEVVTDENGEVIERAVTGVTAAAFDLNGEYLIIGITTAPYLAGYKVNDGTFTPIEVNQTFLAKEPQTLKFSRSGTFLVAVYGGTSYPFTYANGILSPTKASIKTASNSDHGKCVFIDDDVIVGHLSTCASAYACYAFKYDAPTNTFVADTSYMFNGANNIYGLNKSYDGKYVVRCNRESPYLTLYKHTTAERHIYKAGNIVDRTDSYNFDMWGYANDDHSAGTTGFYTKVFSL